MQGKRSEASARRMALGLDPPTDMVKRANGRKGLVSRHGEAAVKRADRIRVTSTPSIIANLAANQDFGSVRGQVKRIFDAGAPRAAQVLVQMVDGKGEFAETPHAVRRAAARDVLEAADCVDRGAASDDKPLAHAQLSDLIELLAELEDRRAEDQATIDITPEPASDCEQSHGSDLT